MNIKMDTAAYSDSEMKLKEDHLLLDVGSPKEEKPPISDLVMKIKIETAVHSDSEAENKIKIKEEAWVLDSDLQNEEIFPSSDTAKIKNSSDMCGMFTEIEIKEEPCWQEGTLTDVKSQPETSSVSDLQEYSEIKDGADEDFHATGSRRLHAQASPSTCSITPYLFTKPDLEAKDGLIGRKENLEFAALNIYEVYVGDVMDTSCIEQTAHSHQSKTYHEHKQSDKIIKCSNSSNKLHVCEICKKSFPQWNTLKAHILFHEGNRPLKCKVGRKSFTNKGKLNTHILIHGGKRPYKCNFCNKSFTLRENLNKHVKYHQGKTLYMCDICDKSFVYKSDLNRHFVIHQGKRPYKCDICDKSFTLKENLNKHIKYHQGKRPYICAICDKSFVYKSDLNKHFVIHQGRRPYKCDFCNKRFILKENLNKHIKYHQSERPYICDTCDKGFTQKGDLKRHMLIHLGKRPYKCDFCEKSFTLKGNLKRHILIHLG